MTTSQRKQKAAFAVAAPIAPQLKEENDSSSAGPAFQPYGTNHKDGDDASGSTEESSDSSSSSGDDGSEGDIPLVDANIKKQQLTSIPTRLFHTVGTRTCSHHRHIAPATDAPTLCRIVLRLLYGRRETHGAGFSA